MPDGVAKIPIPASGIQVVLCLRVALTGGCAGTPVIQPRYKIHHVGIYMGDGHFAHACSSRGVIISRLDDDFWRQCYLTGRRVLETPQ